MATMSSSNSNPRLMMIITSDENILQQIQTNFNPSRFQAIILDSENTSKPKTPEPERPAKTSEVPKTETKKKSLICIICGGTALGRNFGVVSCESCKLFFRRNGLKDPKKIFCHRKNNCSLKYDTRRRCLPCRLRKCLDSGMKRDRLLKKAVKHYEDVDEQFQETSPIHSNDDDDENNIIFPEIEFTEPSVNRSLLTANDCERIENIRSAFENRIELALQQGFDTNQCILANTLSEHVNAHSNSALRLLVFFKQIPEFNQLNVDDKLTLIKYNLMRIIVLNYVLSFKKKADRVLELDRNIPWDRTMMGAIHGYSIFPEIKQLFRPLVLIARSDEKIIHLALIVFILLKSLSTGDTISEPILQDGIGVFRVQTFYTELLWKYLETTYGYEEAFRIMTTLVTQFLSWQTFSLKLRHNIKQRISNNDIDELSPIMKSLFNI